MLLFVLLALISFLIGHCSHEMFVEGVISEDKVTFEQVKPIFKQRCYLCHRPGSGRGDWTDYDQAFEKRLEIFQRVKSKSMPPGNATMMQESERELVLKWVKQGAKR